MLDFVLGLIGTLLYPLFSIIFVFIDGIQSVFYAFAGIGDMTFSSQTITATNEGGETNTGIVYYLFQNSLVKNMLFSIMLLALFLVIIFTVMAFIKNAYAAKQKGWKEIVGNAIKGLGNFILIPVCCLLGVWLANILLQAINGATSSGGANSMSRKLFIAAAYNANEFRKVNDEKDEQGLTWLEKTADSDKVDDLIDWAKKRKMLDSGKAYGWEKIEKGQTNGYYANIVDEIYATTNVSIYEQFSVGKWYQVWSINYLVLIVGGIFMLYVLCALSFAMVRRLFLLIILFIISPGVCAMYPLDEGKAVNSWKGEFIKLVLSAYGAVAGMNIFFSIMPLIDKIELGTGAGNVAMNFSGINTIIQIFILVVGLLCVKELIGIISNFVGGEDAYSKGSGLMKQAVTQPAKKAMKTAGVFAKAAGTKAAGGSFFGSLLSQGKGAVNKAFGIDGKSVKDAYKEGKEKGLEKRSERSKAAFAKSNREKAMDMLQAEGLINKMQYEKLRGDGFVKGVGKAGKNVGRAFGNAGASIGRFVRSETGLHKNKKIDENVINRLLDNAKDKDGKIDTKLQQALFELLAPIINERTNGRIGEGFEGFMFNSQKVVTPESLKEDYEKGLTTFKDQEKSTRKHAKFDQLDTRAKEEEDKLAKFKASHSNIVTIDANGLEHIAKKVKEGVIEGYRAKAQEKDANGNLTAEAQTAQINLEHALNRNENIEEYEKLKETAEEWRDRANEAAEALADSLETAATNMKGELHVDMNHVADSIRDALKSNTGYGSDNEKLLKVMKQIEEIIQQRLGKDKDGKAKK